MAKKQAAVLELEPQVDAIPEIQAEIPAARPVYQPMTSAEIDTLADKLTLEHEAADRILMAVAGGAELTGSQVTLLRSVGLENPFEIQRHVDRLRAILKFQQAAGTAADRNALASEVAQAEAARDAELPAIRQELEDTVKRLQGRIDALESAVSVPAAKLATMAAAVETLRTVRSLPAFVQDKYNVIRGRCKAEFRELFEAKSVVTNRTGVLKLFADSEQFVGSTNVIPHSGPVAVFLSQRNLWANIHDRQIDKAKFSADRAQCQADLAAAQRVIDAQEPLFTAKMADAELARNYYVL